MILSCWHTLRKRCKWCPKLVIAGLISVAIFLLFADEIARLSTTRLIASAVDGRATLKSIRLGLRTIKVEKLRVWTTDYEQPTLSVDQLTCRVTIVNGLRTGVWLSQIAIDRPELALHFDQQGQLQTRWPVSDANDETVPRAATLPFGTLAARNAQFVIYQQGRQPFAIRDMGLMLEAARQQCTIRATIPKIFSGQVEFVSIIDLATQTSDAELTAGPFRADSHDLATMPLVPAAVDDIPWSATGAITAKQTGSFSDVREMMATIRLHDAAVSVSDADEIVRINADARVASGRLQANANGQILSGRLTASADALLVEGTPGRLVVDCTGLQCAALPTALIPERTAGEISCHLDVAGHEVNGALHLLGRAESRVKDGAVHGIEIAPTTLMMAVDGGIGIGGPERSFGTLAVTLLSDGVSLDQLATPDSPLSAPTARSDGTEPPRLPKFVQPSGMVRARLKSEVPLAALTDPTGYLVDGTVDATGVVVNDLYVTQGRGRVLFDGTRGSVDLRNLIITDRVTDQQSSASLLATAEWSPGAEVEANVQIETISAATLARFAQVNGRLGRRSDFGTRHCPLPPTNGWFNPTRGVRRGYFGSSRSRSTATRSQKDLQRVN